MINLVAATAAFLGLHVFVSGTGLRDAVAGKIGERAYLGLFSLASLALIIWMATAFGAAPYIELWQFGIGARHGALALMGIAVFLLVAGLTTPNPTAVGASGLLARDEAAAGILRVTRHPFMWAVVLWALAHLLVNGDAASVVFFGGFGVLALWGPRLIDAKMARRQGENWERFARATSWLPFQAIVEKRNRFSLRELGWWRLALALVLYLAIVLFLHGWLIGAPLYAY